MLWHNWILLLQSWMLAPGKLCLDLHECAGNQGKKHEKAAGDGVFIVIYTPSPFKLLFQWWCAHSVREGESRNLEKKNVLYVIINIFI